MLGLDDTVIDFDILANRPDCLSVLGLAHEASVAAGHPVVEPNYEYTTCGGDINELVKVRVDDPDLCTRYCAAVVKDIKIEPSPLWMREALHKAGRSSDQQHCRYYQLCHAGNGPADARL